MISKLSIITVVYNDKIGFSKTIKSVIEQKLFFPAIEYIVIDGGSRDGTAQLIINYSSEIDCWVSEPDNGIYHAMNKGLVRATGDAILFLNAGDYFVGNVLSNLKIAPVFLKVKYIDIFNRFLNRPIVNERFGISNCHQGIIFENRGISYDENFSICADYKYFLDHGYSSKIHTIESDGFVFFDAVGVSSQKIKERDRQIFEIRKIYFGLFVALSYELKPFLKRCIRLLLGK